MSEFRFRNNIKDAIRVALRNYATAMQNDLSWGDSKDSQNEITRETMTNLEFIISQDVEMVDEE